MYAKETRIECDRGVRSIGFDCGFAYIHLRGINNLYNTLSFIWAAVEARGVSSHADAPVGRRPGQLRPPTRSCLLCYVLRTSVIWHILFRFIQVTFLISVMAEFACCRQLGFANLLPRPRTRPEPGKLSSGPFTSL